MEAHTELETADAAPEPRRVEATIDDLQGFTIVVVDDEPIVTAVLKKGARSQGTLRLRRDGTGRGS